MKMMMMMMLWFVVVKRKISTHTTRTKSRIYARYDNIE
jgi:hypothetical protein